MDMDTEEKINVQQKLCFVEAHAQQLVDYASGCSSRNASKNTKRGTKLWLMHMIWQGLYMERREMMHQIYC